MPKRISKIGDKYNKLKIVSFSSKNVKNSKRKISTVICLCECGKTTETTITKLKNGHTKSCGCGFIETITKHKMAHTREYKTWGSLKQRSTNKNSTRSKDYIGRGITICEKWLTFEGFYEDMGKKPEGKTIDRIDNNKGYCKENCRWATKKEQSNNTRRNIFLEYNNKKQTIAQWAEELEINYCVLLTRIKRGWEISRAFNNKKEV